MQTYSHHVKGFMQVEVVRRKLGGAHPADVMLAELAPLHKSSSHWKSLEVSGPDRPSPLISESEIAAPKGALGLCVCRASCSI